MGGVVMRGRKFCFFLGVFVGVGVKGMEGL